MRSKNFEISLLLAVFFFGEQMCAGAVMLTDLVFWIILVPFLTGESFKLNFVSMNSRSYQFVWFLCSGFLLLSYNYRLCAAKENLNKLSKTWKY